MDKLAESQQWRRPTTAPFPQNWHKFESKPKNGKTYKIRIEDLTPNRYEEASDFMLKYFTNSEPILSSLKIIEDEVSLNGLKMYFYKAMKLQVSIIAVLDEDTPTPEIVAVQLLCVESKNDPPLPEFPGEKMQQISQVIADIKKNVDSFSILGSETYIQGRALCVKPEYRGLNIGYNIFLTLEKIAKTYHIAGAMFFYSSIGAQTIANRVGFKVYNEIVYDEYKNEKGEVIFPVKGRTKSMKLMGIKYT